MKFKKLLSSIKKSAPNWLTACAIVGGALTVKFALDCHIPAKEAVENIKDREADGEKISVQEKIKIIAPIIWKPVLTGTISVGCAIGANKIAMDRLATLGSTLELTQTIKSEYQRQVEKLDPDTAEKINKAIDDRIAEAAPSVSEATIEDALTSTGSGEQLFYDAESGRYFYSSGDHLKAALSEFKRMLYEARDDSLDNQCQSLNDLYECIGLSRTGAGNRVGWFSSDHDDIRYLFSGDYTKDMKSYIVMRFYPDPRTDYDDPRSEDRYRY